MPAINTSPAHPAAPPAGKDPVPAAKAGTIGNARALEVRIKAAFGSVARLASGDIKILFPDLV